MRLRSRHSVAALWLPGSLGTLPAQAPGLTRTRVTKADVAVPDREAVIAKVDVAPGGVAGWRTHPGDEIRYVAEGEATLTVAGQPPRKVSAGEGFVIPAVVLHIAKSDGASATQLVRVYGVEKGKPPARPASAPAQSGPRRRFRAARFVVPGGPVRPQE